VMSPAVTLMCVSLMFLAVVLLTRR